MKIIFLDFDGVMNSQKWMQERGNPFDFNYVRQNLDKEAVARVEAIAQATGAKIVISSTWRQIYRIEHLREILKRHGLTAEVIDTTPKLHAHRGIEIADWLNTHGPVESFVILDDDSDMVHLMHRLVQTSWMTGLLDEHVQQAIAMLQKPITRDLEDIQKDPNWVQCICEDWELDVGGNANCQAHGGK